MAMRQDSKINKRNWLRTVHVRYVTRELFTDGLWSLGQAKVSPSYRWNEKLLKLKF